jgi:hypothetical protein
MGSLRNRNELWNRIQNGSNEIIEIFDSVRNSLRRRAHACLQANDRRFEHLRLIKKKNVSFIFILHVTTLVKYVRYIKVSIVDNYSLFLNNCSLFVNFGKEKFTK